MKILFAEKDPLLHPNPYLVTFVNAICEVGRNTVKVDWGKERFWSEEVFQYDIVHIMWPQFLLQGRSAEDLLCRLTSCREKGVKIVSTCHNLTPHYSKDRQEIESYRVVYEHSDLIFHLGKYSLNLFESESIGVRNVLLMHHVYDDRYKESLSKVIFGGIPGKVIGERRSQLKYTLNYGPFLR